MRDSLFTRHLPRVIDIRPLQVLACAKKTESSMRRTFSKYAKTNIRLKHCYVDT